jgi:hypothetical protein
MLAVAGRASHASRNSHDEAALRACVAWIISARPRRRQARGRSGPCRSARIETHDWPNWPNPLNTLPARMGHLRFMGGTIGGIDGLAPILYNKVTPTVVDMLYTVSFAPLYTTAAGYYSTLHRSLAYAPCRHAAQTNRQRAFRPSGRPTTPSNASGDWAGSASGSASSLAAATRFARRSRSSLSSPASVE